MNKVTYSRKNFLARYAKDGTIFHYPSSDKLYMLSTGPNTLTRYAVQLDSGMMFQIAPDKEICTIKSGLKVTIEANDNCASC